LFRVVQDQWNLPEILGKNESKNPQIVGDVAGPVGARRVARFAALVVAAALVPPILLAPSVVGCIAAACPAAVFV